MRSCACLKDTAHAYCKRSVSTAHSGLAKLPELVKGCMLPSYPALSLHLLQMTHQAYRL
jgi:hypothetical protein